MRLRDIVIDSREPASPARFWAAAHDGFTVMLDPEGNEFCVLDSAVHG